MSSEKEGGNQSALTSEAPAWECSETDRPHYLQWVYEVSLLPVIIVQLGECHDAKILQLARGWKTYMEDWMRQQDWLQSRGNPNAWKSTCSQEYWLNRYWKGRTSDDIEEGNDLMNEMGYYGISDDWEIKI